MNNCVRPPKMTTTTTKNNNNNNDRKPSCCHDLSMLCDFKKKSETELTDAVLKKKRKKVSLCDKPAVFSFYDMIVGYCLSSLPTWLHEKIAGTTTALSVK